MSEWRKRILRILFVDHRSYRFTTKENVLSNFKGHIDMNTEDAFSSLLDDGLILKANSNDKIMFCLNVFDRLEDIQSEITGTKSGLAIDIDQPLDEEFINLQYVFPTEANRAYPNRGKYYHCVKQSDETFWITLMKPKGNSKCKRLVIGSLKIPKSRLYKIYEAIEIVARNSVDGIIIKKHVEDLEPKACGNTRQYSKAAFDILEYLNKIQAVESKGRMMKYQLVKHQQQRIIQLTLDDIFDEVSKMRVRVC